MTASPLVQEVCLSLCPTLVHVRVLSLSQNKQTYKQTYQIKVCKMLGLVLGTLKGSVNVSGLQ